MAGLNPLLHRMAQVAAVAVVAVTAAAVPLKPAAGDNDGWGHHRWQHSYGDEGRNGGGGVYFYGGPSYYYAPPPPVYYAPPPPYYAPPPVYYGSPSVGFSIEVPLRR